MQVQWSLHSTLFRSRIVAYRISQATAKSVGGDESLGNINLMPGARGSPQGCGTCKRRKVACDRQRPLCLRCTKAGLECSGYDKVLTFVNRDASNIHSSGRQALTSAFQTGTGEKRQKSAQRRNAASPSMRSRSESPASIAVSPTKSIVKQEHLVSQEELHIALRNGTAAASLQDRQKLFGTSVIRLPMLGLLTRYYVAEGDALNQAELYNQINKVLDPTRIFDSAIAAAALTRCGQVDHDQELVFQGTDQYGRTIKGLMKVLQDPKLRLEDETLAVCVLLSAYELFAGTDPYLSPWISHMDGVAQLIKLRGPERHQSSLGHQIFLHYRTSAALQAVMSRKSSFLSTLEWLTIPFVTTPKDFFHLLLDLVFDLASILELSDTAAIISVPEIRTRQQINARCTALSQRFESWFKAPQLGLGRTAWRKIRSKIMVAEDRKNEGRVFTSYYEFENLVVAQVLLSYWAASIILSTTALLNVAALAVLTPPSTAESSSSQESMLDSMKKNAIDIAKSIPYCLQPQHKTAGPIITVHPLHVAMQVFSKFDMQRELRWCEEVFDIVCRGGSPFKDAPSEESGDARTGKESGEVELRYQLHLPKFGKSALSLG